ncbi:MAG: lipocalin family protein [Phenylobacterium sp.]
MLNRLTVALVVATALLASPAAAMPQTVGYLEPTKMMGRWYEIARLPNSIQKGCQAGASDWTRSADGFSVVQSCHKGSPDGPLALWRAKARVADPTTNAKFKMTFFGGLVSQEYWVLDRRDADGWLILSTHDGKYLWLMCQRPTLPASARAQAVIRIRQLGFDPNRLEWPAPARG